MNILVVSNVYPSEQFPNLGIFIKERVRYLNNPTKKIIVVAPIPISPPFSILSKKWYKLSKIPYKSIADDVEIYRPKYLLFSKNMFRRCTGIFMSLSLFKVMKKELKQNRIDLIHAHFSIPTGIAVDRLSKKYNIPYIVTEHFSRLEEDLRNNIFKKQYRRVYLNAKQVITVSNSTAKLINNAFPKISPMVIPNGVDTDIFKPVKIQKKLNGIINMLSIGGLEDWKGHKFLIEAVYNLTLSGLDLKLVIIGEGSQREFLLNLINKYNLSKKISILPYVEHKSLVSWFNKADLYVHPSLSESFSVVTIEALACGLPVVVTECGGPENFVNSKVGIVVNKNSVSALQEGISSVIKNYQSYDYDYIREYCVSNFSYTNISKIISNVYDKVMSC